MENLSMRDLHPQPISLNALVDIFLNDYTDFEDREEAKDELRTIIKIARQNHSDQLED